MAFATIQGTVDFVKRGGKGFTVVEQWMSKQSGKEIKRRWSVWFDGETVLEVGQVVKLRGRIDAQVGKPWIDRDGNERDGGVEWALNGATFDSGASSQPGDTNTRSEAPSSQAAENTNAYSNSEVPF